VSMEDYQASLRLYGDHYPFYGLIMAAMRRADPPNLQKLVAAFPDTWAELGKRYNVPGGYLPGEYDPDKAVSVDG